MPTITAEDLAALVLEMMDAQQIYFKTKFKPDLYKAIKLETAVRTLCKTELGDAQRQRTARADAEEEQEHKDKRDRKAGVGVHHERCLNCNRFVALGVTKCPSCGQVPYDETPQGPQTVGSFLGA